MGAKVGAPLLAGAAVVTILLTFFRITFLINDDTTLTSLVNGDYTGKSTSSLVVAPPMFGHVVRLGYALFPHLPWYGITLYALQIIGWTAIGATVFTLGRRPPVAERLLVTAVILAVAPWMILRVSFTPTSLLLGVAGILVFAVGAKVPGRTGAAYAVTGGLLLGAVYLLRVDSFLAVVIASAPVLAVIIVKSGLRRSALFALVVGTLVLAGLGTSRLEYSRSADWRAFMKMNSARSSLHDTPRLDSTNVSQADLQRIGWTRNDLRQFADFFYPDQRVYSDQSIRTLASLSPPVRRNLAFGDAFDSLVHDSSDQLVDRGPVLATLVLVGALLALRWNRFSAAATIASFVWFVGVLLVLLLYLRLPGRVLIPLEAGAAFIAAVVPASLTSSPPRTSIRWPWTSAAVVALVALLGIAPAWNGIRSTPKMSREDRRGVQASHALLAKLDTFDPHGVYVARGDLFGRWADPLSAGSPFANPRLVPLGWATNSPLFTARLERLGIGDLYTALQTNPHVYLLGFRYEAKQMALFYSQHRSVKVRFTARLRALPMYFGNKVEDVSVWSASFVRAAK